LKAVNNFLTGEYPYSFRLLTNYIQLQADKDYGTGKASPELPGSLFASCDEMGYICFCKGFYDV